MGNNHTRREFLLTAGAVGAALGSAAVLVGCSIPLDPSYIKRQGTGERVGNTGGNLRFSMRYPFSFDPFFVRELSGIQIAGLLFDPLVRYDPRKGEVVAAAAQSWTVSDDGTIFRFRLAEGRTFHNGEPVTAADFKYAWERICAPTAENAVGVGVSYSVSYLGVIAGAKAFMAGEAKEISGLRAVTERQLEVILEEPHFEFLKTLGYPGLAPVPASEVQGKPDLYFYKPIGNGPFRLSNAWGAGDPGLLKLERFESYLGEAPPLKSVEFVFFADDTTSSGNASGGDISGSG
ncbi:MAG TPA: hypothetical protein DEB24_03440 [Coriobacteriia bacterium]|nr:hypothetical protein [Coriobacteriia bacterium]